MKVLLLLSIICLISCLFVSNGYRITKSPVRVTRLRDSVVSVPDIGPVESDPNVIVRIFESFKGILPSVAFPTVPSLSDLTASFPPLPNLSPSELPPWLNDAQSRLLALPDIHQYSYIIIFTLILALYIQNYSKYVVQLEKEDLQEKLQSIQQQVQKKESELDNKTRSVSELSSQIQSIQQKIDSLSKAVESNVLTIKQVSADLLNDEIFLEKRSL